MAPIEAPDMITPGIEDVVANAKLHGNAGTGDHTMVLNMGPQHPSTHGVLRLVLEIDGEAIVALAPDIGYL
jgi:NADH-quinone oxidoreductase subunit D